MGGRASCVFISRRRRLRPPPRRRARWVSQTATRLAPRSRASRRRSRGREAPRAWPSGIYVGALRGPIRCASKLCRSALSPRRAPQACEFVHGWSEAARAANFETLAAYGRLYLNARARRDASTRGRRPDPLLSPSWRPHGVGAAPWACHSAYRTARKSYVLLLEQRRQMRPLWQACGCEFWPRGGPSRGRQDPSSRRAGVAGMTLLKLESVFFLVLARGFCPVCARAH